MYIPLTKNAEDSFDFSVTLTFPTYAEAQAFKKHPVTASDCEYQESEVTKFLKWPTATIYNERNYLKNTCESLKAVIHDLHSYSLANLVKLEFELSLSASTDVLKDECNVLPKGKVHITIHKEFTDMLFIIMHLKDLDETADKIKEVYG